MDHLPAWEWEDLAADGGAGNIQEYSSNLRRGGHVAVAAGGHVYVLGGRHRQGCPADVQCRDRICTFLSPGDSGESGRSGNPRPVRA